MSPGLKKKMAEERSLAAYESEIPKYDKDSDEDIPLAALLELKGQGHGHGQGHDGGHDLDYKSEDPGYDKDSDEDIPLTALLELKGHNYGHGQGHDGGHGLDGDLSPDLDHILGNDIKSDLSRAEKKEDGDKGGKEGNLNNTSDPDGAKDIGKEADVKEAEKEEYGHQDSKDNDSDASNPKPGEGFENEEGVNNAEKQDHVNQDGNKGNVDTSDTSDTKWNLYLDGSEEDTEDDMLPPLLCNSNPYDSPDSSSEESVQSYHTDESEKASATAKKMRPKRLASSESQLICVCTCTYHCWSNLHL